MRTQRLICLVVCTLVCGFPEVSFGQQDSFSAPGLLIEETANNAPASLGFRQAALSKASGIVGARRDARESSQIRVTVQYLMVDSETRAAIYASLERDRIARVLHAPPRTDPFLPAGASAAVNVIKQIHVPARVTSYTLNQPEFKEVLQQAVASPNSEVNVAPKIIVLDGNDVEMTDLVQRPFVIDFHVNGESIEPIEHVMDEGTRLRLVARVDEGTETSNRTIHLDCELAVLRILDVQTDQVFGVADRPLSVQLPIQLITSASISRPLAVGQTLLVDPHVSKTQSKDRETAVPMMSRLPYLSRNFKRADPESMEQHMMLLLQPSIETPTR